MSSLEGNQLVAKRRGEKWKKSLLEGKLDVELNPTTLRVLRVECGISQVSIAKEIQVSLATYGNIERGKIGVKISLASYLSNYFSIPIQLLFDKQGEKYYCFKKMLTKPLLYQDRL